MSWNCYSICLEETSIKSTFAIDIPNNPTSSVSATASPICGFGWRFHCSIGAESSTTTPRLLDANSEYIPWRRVELIFEPNRIQGASYGRLTFHTTIENLRPLDTEPCNNYCDIPLQYRNQVTIGVYMRLGDAGRGAPRLPGARKGKGKVKGNPTTTLGRAKITIMTEFPTDIGLTLPLPRDPRVDAALAATICGEDMVDVKFYVYTRRGTIVDIDNSLWHCPHGEGKGFDVIHDCGQKKSAIVCPFLPGAPHCGFEHTRFLPAARRALKR
ncbi:hypothetical protein B0H14DRAFT_3442773 [Mycena olivaceomarginata]|nr:hypothetical protein B0H14DRAFT_3442773 [Mycena olivaceomarginata]